MSLVNHNNTVFTQERINESFSKEHPIGEIFNAGKCWRRQVLETNGIANLVAEDSAYFLCNTGSNSGCSNTTRLSTANDSALDAPTTFIKVLWDLGSFAGACLSNYDKDTT